jgi:hypothetical protein
VCCHVIPLSSFRRFCAIQLHSLFRDKRLRALRLGFWQRTSIPSVFQRPPDVVTTSNPPRDRRATSLAGVGAFLDTHPVALGRRVCLFVPREAETDPENTQGGMFGHILACGAA